MNRLWENELLSEALLESLEIFILFGSIVALIIGIVLYLKPDVIRRVNNWLNKWYSGRRKLKSLEIMRDSDHIYYHYNKFLGWPLLLLSIYCIYFYVDKLFSAQLTATQLYNNYWDFISDIIIETMILTFTVVSIAGLPVWILLIFAPDKLKKVSKIFNQWISTRLLILPLEKMHTGFDLFVLEHHRIFGAIFALGSIFVLGSILLMIL